MKHDIERLAPAVDWCTAAAYQSPVSSEMLGAIEREISTLVANASGAERGSPEVPGFVWCILFAVMVVTLL